jgi:hypothetical protein
MIEAIIDTRVRDRKVRERVDNIFKPGKPAASARRDPAVGARFGCRLVANISIATKDEASSMPHTLWRFRRRSLSHRLSAALAQPHHTPPQGRARHRSRARGPILLAVKAKELVATIPLGLVRQFLYDWYKVRKTNVANKLLRSTAPSVEGSLGRGFNHRLEPVQRHKRTGLPSHHRLPIRSRGISRFTPPPKLTPHPRTNVASRCP